MAQAGMLSLHADEGFYEVDQREGWRFELELAVTEFERGEAVSGCGA